MATASLPQSAKILIEGDRPSLGAVRVLRRVAAQDTYEQKELAELHRSGLPAKVDKDVRSAILAYALDYLADAEEALADVKDSYGQALLGLIYAELDEHDDALAIFDKIKDMPEAVCEKIRVLISSQQFEAAEKLLDDMADSAEREFLTGLLYEAQGAVERAISFYEGALEREPEHVEAAFKLGVLLDRIGDDDMAVEYYLVCADVHPHYLPGVINLGILYDERGEANAAIDCFRQVLAYNPTNRRALLLLRDSKASRSMYYDEREERERERMEKILKTPVNDFELSVRSRNCLAKMNIFTLGDLISISEQEMLNYKNFGETSLREVKEMLDARGLRLGQLREHEDRGLTKADQKTLGESLERLELSSRSMKVLESLGCSKIGDVVHYSDLELYRAEGSGQSVVQELSTALGAYGLGLKKPEIR
ncbi:MAG: tetratricopeptide repeat protein [Planctomycetota bacterium]|jgi:DNA-directed RNA polymerase subunit alpha|nr:tetratricopeptide repeat protein [Planctomycetota bacterium]